MLLSIIYKKKTEMLKKKELKEEIRKIIILYKNLNLIDKFNKNYISIIILKVILKYMKIKSDIKNISLNKKKNKLI